jgi:hydroxypyruvate isomerase
MKVSVCADMVYAGIPTVDAMRLIKAAGADAVEFWGSGGKDIKAIAKMSRELDLPVSVFCGPGDLISPDAPNNCPLELIKLAEICDQLNCRKLISISGRAQCDWTPNNMHDRLIATVEAAIPVLEKYDLQLLLEPLNASEMPYMTSSREAFDVCRMVNNPHVAVLYDIYHMQYMEGNLINTIKANLKYISHFHAADLPGRLAPGTGEINYPNIVNVLNAAKYDGYIGLEYQPSGDKEVELKYVISMLKS